jgi:hypothetical protein
MDWYNNRVETGRYYNIDRHARICNMCNNNDIEDEYHFILECSKYVEIRRKYIKPYYCINPSATAYRYINANYKQYMIHYTQYIII